MDIKDIEEDNLEVGGINEGAEEVEEAEEDFNNVDFTWDAAMEALVDEVEWDVEINLGPLDDVDWHEAMFTLKKVSYYSCNTLYIYLFYIPKSPASL